jgi:hypothetical protein
MYTDYNTKDHAFQIEQIDLYDNSPITSVVQLVWVDKYHKLYNKWGGAYHSTLAQNNKIYISSLGGNSVSIIHHPDKKGSKCGLELNAIQTKNLVSRRIGIPYGANRAPSMYFEKELGCGNEVGLSISNHAMYKNLKIFWGDGDSTLLFSDSAMKAKHYHTYLNSGVYHIEVSGITKSCNYPLHASDSIVVTKKPRWTESTTLIPGCNFTSVSVKDTIEDARYYKMSWGDGSYFDTFIDPKDKVVLNLKHLYTEEESVVLQRALLSYFHPIRNCNASSIDSLNIKFLEHPVADFSISGQGLQQNDSSYRLCLKEKQNIPVHLRFSGDSATAFHIKWGDDYDTLGMITSSATADFLHTYSDSGLVDIRLHLKNEYGCVDSQSLKLQILPAAKISTLQMDSAICLGDSLHFNFDRTALNADSLLWFFDGERVLERSSFVVPNSEGVYGILAIIQSSEICWDTVSSSVEVNKLPHLDVLDIQIDSCPNHGKYQFDIVHDARSAVLNVNGSETTLAKTQSVRLQLLEQINRLHLFLESDKGCKSFWADSVSLQKENNVRIYPEMDNVFCENEQDSIKYWHSMDVEGTEIWSLNHLITDTFFLAEHLDPGEHLLKLSHTTNRGCRSSDSLILTIVEVPSVQLILASNRLRINQWVQAELESSAKEMLSSASWFIDQKSVLTHGLNYSRQWPDTGIHQLLVEIGFVNGCRLNLYDSFNVVNQFENQNVLVYPNPGSDKVFVDIENFEKGIHLKLYDDLGRMLLNEELNQSYSEYSIESYPSGIYELRIELEGELLYNGKLIKL